MKGKSWFLGLTLTLLSLVVWAPMSFGAGFALYEGSARGNALGGTLVGRADDPSAIYYNPAGITQLPGLQLMAGGTVILPSTTLNTVNLYDGGKAETDTEDNVWFPPHLYATYQFSDNLWFGAGLYSRFGLGTEFDENWVGRYNSYNAQIQTLTFNPNVAVKLGDHWSIAAGVNVMWFDLKLEQKIDATGIFVKGGKGDALAAMGIPTTVNDPRTNLLDVDSSLEGDTFGYGFNLALHYKPFDWLAAGISYQSQVKQNIDDGDADFSKSATLSAIPGTDAWFNDTGASGTVKLPDMYSFGLMVKPIERLSVEAGLTYTRWSTYDQLRIKYEDPIIIAPVAGGVLSVDEAVKVKDWTNVWRYQVGVEYKATDWLDLRLGYIFDESPIPNETVDYLVPASDRHLYNTGLGFHWNKYTLDFSYTYLMIEDRDISQRQIQDGVLESETEGGDTHLIGLSLSYKF